MNAPRFEEVISSLGLADHAEAWRCFWPCMDGLADPGDTWLYAPGRLEGLCRKLSLGDEPAAALREGLEGVLVSPSLRVLLAQAIRTFCMAHVPPPPMPKPSPKLGAWARVFHALSVLGCYDTTRQRHADRGIPEAVSLATFNDVGRWMRTYHETHGQWGFAQADWLFNHVSGRLIELGRLQFGRSGCDLPYHVFRAIRGEGVAILAADGCRIRPDGQFITADRGIDRDGPHIVTRFDLRDREAVGHRVNEQRGIEQAPVTLPLSDWQRVIEPGTPVLDVHIPGYAPLDDAECEASFRRAMEFVPHYFPEHRFTGFTCSSWLMDPQLVRYLSPKANVVKFQQRFRLAPAPWGWDFQHFERVFGGPVSDPATAPRDNSLRKALLEHVESGGRWRYGGGIILRDDLRV